MKPIVLAIPKNWLVETLAEFGPKSQAKLVTILIDLLPPEQWCRWWDSKRLAREGKDIKTWWKPDTPVSRRVYQAANRFLLYRIRWSKRLGQIEIEGKGPTRIIKLAKSIEEIRWKLHCRKLDRKTAMEIQTIYNNRKNGHPNQMEIAKMFNISQGTVYRAVKGKLGMKRERKNNEDK
jgi:hypothetical protein